MRPATVQSSPEVEILGLGAVLTMTVRTRRRPAESQGIPGRSMEVPARVFQLPDHGLLPRILQSPQFGQPVWTSNRLRRCLVILLLRLGFQCPDFFLNCMRSEKGECLIEQTFHPSLHPFVLTNGLF